MFLQLCRRKLKFSAQTANRKYNLRIEGVIVNSCYCLCYNCNLFFLDVAFVLLVLIVAHRKEEPKQIATISFYLNNLVIYDSICGKGAPESVFCYDLINFLFYSGFNM